MSDLPENEVFKCFPCGRYVCVCQNLRWWHYALVLPWIYYAGRRRRWWGRRRSRE